MIVNSQNGLYYSLILDTKDLNNLDINLMNFLGNSNNTNTYIEKILNKLNINITDNIKTIDILTFNFQIFNIKIYLNKTKK